MDQRDISTDKETRHFFNLEQESPKLDKHCIKVIFLQNEDLITPQSCFGGSEIIINLSGRLSISSEYPIAQPGFPTRGEFRHGFDIVIPPILNDPLGGGNLSEQYDALHNKRSKLVSISLKCKLPQHLKHYFAFTALLIAGTQRSFPRSCYFIG